MVHITKYATGVKILKRFSIISCVASFASTAFVLSDVIPTKVSKPIKYALMSTVCFASASSTIILYFGLKGYCLKIKHLEKDVLLTTMKLFNTTTTRIPRAHLYIEQGMLNNLHVKPAFETNGLNHFYVMNESLPFLNLEK